MKTVFVSYSRQPNGDTIRPFLKTVEALIEREHPAVDLFLDIDIAVAQDWRAAVRRGMSEATVFLCVLEPDFWRSPHCRQEVVEALERADHDPDFRLLSLRIRNIDTTELDLDAVGHYARLRSVQALDGRDGLDQAQAQRLATAISELLRAAPNERSSSTTHRQDVRGVVLATEELLRKVFNQAGLVDLLTFIPRLRPLRRHLSDTTSFAGFVHELVQELTRQPELALTLFYRVRSRHKESVTEVDHVLEQWRSLEYQADRDSDPIEAVFHYLLTTFPRTKLSALADRFALADERLFIATELPHREQCRWLVETLHSRERWTMVFYWEVERASPEEAKRLTRLYLRIPVPARRVALIELLLVLFQEDARALEWWVRGSDQTRRILDVVPFGRSPLALARTIVEECDLVGDLDEAFFSRLLLRCPERATDIRQVAKPWVAEVGAPTGRFWRDRLTLWMAALCATPGEYDRLLDDLGLPPADRIDDEIPAALRCRLALDALERQALLNRRIFAVLLRRSPERQPELLALERMMIQELPADSPLLALEPPRATPTAFGPKTMEAWIAELVLDEFTGPELRRLVARAFEDPLPHELPAPPVSRASLANALVQLVREHLGALDPLFAMIARARPHLADTLAPLHRPPATE